MVGIVRTISLAIAILTSTLASEAVAWGSIGHQATGEIAARFLSPGAKRETAQLLGSATPKRLGKAARWADKVARPRNPKSAAWHYVSVPTKRRRYDHKDCAKHGIHGTARPNECVVAMIRKFARIAGDRRFGKRRRTEALYFVIHFVGDIHQPLHCGHREGRRDEMAGTAVMVKLGDRKAVSLHKFWDTTIVARLQIGSSSIGKHLAAQITRSSLKKWSMGGAHHWCSESVRIAHSYAYPPGAKRAAPAVSVSDEFANRSLRIVQLRLQMSGVRIATTLNRIFARR